MGEVEGEAASTRITGHSVQWCQVRLWHGEKGSRAATQLKWERQRWVYVPNSMYMSLVGRIYIEAFWNDLLSLSLIFHQQDHETGPSTPRGPTPYHHTTLSTSSPVTQNLTMTPTPSIATDVSTSDVVSSRYLRADTPNFDLSGGMDREEYIFLGCYGGFMVLMYLLYWRDVMKPLKLLAVFVHEMGHAVAAWLTCGRVHSVTVMADESGLAVYQPGLKVIIYPAGYVGGSFWGAMLVTLSADRMGSIVGASLMCLSFCAALVWNPNKLVVRLSTGFLCLTAAAVLVELFILESVLQYLTLFYGVSFGYYAVKDTFDDCVYRNLPDSDSTRCSQNLWPCCAPRFIGIQMLLLAISLQVLGLYFALVWLMTDEQE